jgi:DNA-binding PadR family transcriptional regulator
MKTKFRMGIFDFLRGNKPDTSSKADVIVYYDPPLLDANTLPLDSNKLSVRDKFILLLISKTSISHPHTLMMRLDRCDFPGKPEGNLSNLVNNGLLYISETNGFGHPRKYSVTELGEEFVKNRIEHTEIIEHVKKMSDPDFMLKLVQGIFSKMTRFEQ